MNILLTVVIAIVTALISAVGAGFMGALFVDWYRIPGREGGSTYFVAFLALLGFVIGLVAGIVWARICLSSAEGAFWKGLGYSLITVICALFVVLAVGWLGADLPPKLDGHKLDLEVEVKLPPSIEIPTLKETEGRPWYITLTAMSGKRTQEVGYMIIGQACINEGSKILPAHVFIHTSDAQKTLGVGLGDRPNQFLQIPLAAKPGNADKEWSPWIDRAHTGDLVDLPAAESVSVRYRIVYHSEAARD